MEQLKFPAPPRVIKIKFDTPLRGAGGNEAAGRPVLHTLNLSP
jgi:hypothetical protein